jgi:hypothetical protein
MTSAVAEPSLAALRSNRQMLCPLLAVAMAPGFVFLGEEIPAGGFTLDAVSPNGRLVVGHQIANGNCAAWMIKDDAASKMEGVTDKRIRHVFVNDSGTVTFNVYDGVFDVGHVWTAGAVRQLRDLSGGNSRVAATGLENTGEVLSVIVYKDVRALDGGRPLQGEMGAFVGDGWSKLKELRTPEAPVRKLGDTWLAELVGPTSKRRWSNGQGVWTEGHEYVAPTLVERNTVTPYELPDIPIECRVTATTPDLSYTAGVAQYGTKQEALIWSGSRLRARIPYPVTLRSISGSGEVAVGYRRINRTTTKAVLWSSSRLVEMDTFLTDRGVALPRGWRTIDAAYVSPDGRTIIGTAQNDASVQRPFRAHME